jgi:hypothetical protein
MGYVNVPTSQPIAAGGKFFNYDASVEFTILSELYSLDGDRYITYQAKGGPVLCADENDLRRSLYVKQKHDLKEGDVFHFETVPYSDIKFLYVSENKVIRIGQGSKNSRYYTEVNSATLSSYVNQCGYNNYDSIVILKNITTEYNVTVS